MMRLYVNIFESIKVLSPIIGPNIETKFNLFYYKRSTCLFIFSFVVVTVELFFKF